MRCTIENGADDGASNIIANNAVETKHGDGHDRIPRVGECIGLDIDIELAETPTVVHGHGAGGGPATNLTLPVGRASDELHEPRKPA